MRNQCHCQDSVNMSTPQSSKSLVCGQSSELKTIVDDNTISLLNAEKAIKSDLDGGVNHKCGKGINIKFQDITYRARRNIIWDRCKLSKHTMDLIFIS